MKIIETLTDERFARPAAGFLKAACYFVICFYFFCTVLSFMERQTFFLHTKKGTFEGAIYAEEYHDPHSRSMTVSTGDDIHVWTDANDQIGVTVQIGIALLYAVYAVPMMAAFWFLSRVFLNIQKGRIFIEQNSVFLLYCGLLQFSAAVFVPFIKLLICGLMNLVSDSQMSVSTGQAMLNMSISSISFIVAAYIIHYGVHLHKEEESPLNRAGGLRR